MSWDQERFDALRARMRQARGDYVEMTADEQDRLVSVILARSHEERRRRQHLMRGVMLAVPVVLVLLGGVAYGLLRSPVNPAAVVCWAAADLESSRYGAMPEVTDGLAHCVDVWESMALVNEDVTPGSVPPLIGCLGQDETLWVFPSLAEETCGDLALPEAGTTEIAAEIIDLRRRLEAYIESEPCVAIDDAAREARDVVADLGLERWTVTVEAPPPDRPCASLAFDPSASHVIIVGDVASTG